MQVSAIRLLRTVLFSVCASGAVLAPAGVAAQDTAALPWHTDFDQALTTAKAEQRLTLVCFNMDGEEANERALQMYRSAEFRKATANVVCVLCSADVHGAEGETCPRFANCSCREHIASEKKARRHFFGTSTNTLAAQHLLLFPDGIVAWHAIYDVVPDDLYKAIVSSEKLKTQTEAQHVRSQHNELGSLSRKAGKDENTAYMQLQALVVQTPTSHLCDTLAAIRKDVAEHLLQDFCGLGREQALVLLEATAKHPTKSLRDRAAALAVDVRKRPREDVVAATPAVARPVGPQPLTAPLDVLGRADDLERVVWAGSPHTLADSRHRVTVVWYFVPEMQGLASAIARMNLFAQANRSRGIETVGLAATKRTDEVIAKLATLGFQFPVGAFVTAAGYKPSGVESFPSWVVLDPETNVVYRSPQDGSSFEWDAGRDLALQMLVTPSYVAQIKVAPAGK